MIKKMMCVNRQDRWTAVQLLEHPWIKMGSDVLKRNNLSAAQILLKKHLVKMRFRKGVNTVIAVNRLSKTSAKSGITVRRTTPTPRLKHAHSLTPITSKASYNTSRTPSIHPSPYPLMSSLIRHRVSISQSTTLGRRTSHYTRTSRYTCCGCACCRRGRVRG